MKEKESGQGKKQKTGSYVKWIFWFAFLFLQVFLSDSRILAAENEKVVVKAIKMTAPGQITLSWNPVSDAYYYRIFRKENNGWVGIENVPSSVKKYVHNASEKFPIEYGKTYYYTVRAYYKKTKTFSPYNKTGFPVRTNPAEPVLKEIVRTSKNTVTFSWEPADGARTYLVYYKEEENGIWKRLVQVTSDQTSIVHKSSTAFPLKYGHVYYYTVRAYDSEKKLLSTYNKESLAVKMPLAAPKLGELRYIGKNVSFTWNEVAGATHYYIYYRTALSKWKKIGETGGKEKGIYLHRSTTLYPLKEGTTYYYTVRAYDADRDVLGPYDKTGISIQIPKSVSMEKGKSTIKRLLQTALQPVGSTMYILGGGWNIEDSGAGAEGVTIGVSPRWEEFYNLQDGTYNHRKHYYEVHNGLDCSGYVGWTIYNIMNTKNNQEGYVMGAVYMAREYAAKGWGTYNPAWKVQDFKAGDIMSAGDHVYIVVGQCSDGSVILLHSSPPGVQISGTTTLDGNKNSLAIRYANAYMKKYYPNWYAKYPDSSRGASYLTSYSQMRWDISGDSVMTDPEGYHKMNAAYILKDLFK